MQKNDDLPDPNAYAKTKSDPNTNPPEDREKREKKKAPVIFISFDVCGHTPEIMLETSMAYDSEQHTPGTAGQGGNNRWKQEGAWTYGAGQSEIVSPMLFTFCVSPMTYALTDW